MASGAHSQLSAAPQVSRTAQVQAAIAEVRDPEIDETVAALNFIVGTDIEGDAVTVTLRLPTFWCPANFVFMMGGDIRDAVLALPWVRHFKFRLVDHFAADEISHSITEGHSFPKTFPALAKNDLGDLRHTFDRKAFLMRQGALVEFMRRNGFTDNFLARARIADLQKAVEADRDRLAELASDYLKKREAIGLGISADDRVITTPEGRPVEPAELQTHLREARKVTMSAQSNGEMCRILMSARRSGATCTGDGDAFHTEKGNS